MNLFAYITDYLFILFHPFIHAAVWSDRAWLRPFPFFVMSAGGFTRTKLISPFVYQTEPILVKMIFMT